MIHGVGKDFAVPADSCDQSSVRDKELFNNLLDPIDSLHLDGMRREAFQIRDGPSFPIYFLSRGRERQDRSLEKKKKNKGPDPVSFGT